jgi:phage terminase large subunit
MTRREVALGVLRRLFSDPIAFVVEVLRATPDVWQRDVLGASPTARQQAIVGSKGVGKTSVLAWLILWFLFTRPESNIAVTSISGDNLRDGLWKELAKWIQASPVLTAAFEWQSSRIVSRERPSTWFVSARQWSKSADAQQQSQTLAGLHADYTMFVIDEAGSVPRAVAVTAEAALASGLECRLVIGGNPERLDGPLYDAAVTHREHWDVVTVSGDPDDPKRAPRVSVDWAREQIQKWGRDNPFVKVNVLGQWPEASLNALLGVEEVTAAMGRHLREHEYTFAQKRLGIDPSRFGGDRTVIWPRQGLASFRPIVLRPARGSALSVDVANRVLRAKAQWGSELEFIDSTGGWGAGIADVLLSNGCQVIDVQFSAPALDSRYVNRRSECWMLMADAIRRGAALPNLPELTAELTEPTYSFTGGKFVLEPKDAIKARLGRSPDLAEAQATTYALPEMPQGLATGRGSVGRVKTHDTEPVETWGRA